MTLSAHREPLAPPLMLVGNSPENIDRCSEQIWTFSDCCKPFPVNVQNLGAAVELGKPLVDCNPKCPITTRQGNRIRLDRQVFREHFIIIGVRSRSAD